MAGGQELHSCLPHLVEVRGSVAATCEVGEPEGGRDPSHVLLTLQWELEDAVVDKQVVWGQGAV